MSRHIYSVYYANCNHLTNKVLELQLILNSNRFDVLCFVETFLTSDFLDSELLGNCNYILHRRDRPTGLGGGICIFVRKSVSCVLVPLPDDLRTVEVVSLDVLFPDQTLRLTCVYRPPSYDEPGNGAFNDSLAAAISFISSQNLPSIICGDFNLRDFDWTSFTVPNSPHYEAMYNCFLEGAYSQFVHSPTYPSSGNILDLVLCNEPALMSACDVVEPFVNSDHCAIQFSVAAPVQPTPCSEDHVFKDYAHADYSAINDWILSINWGDVFNACTSVEDAWLIFSNLLNFVVDTFVPIKRRCASAKRYPAHILQLQAKKKRLWRKRRSAGGLSRYDKVVKLCRKAIRRFFVKQEERVITSKNQNTFFKYINSKLSTRGGIPPLKRNDGSFAVDDAEKARLLNSYFGSVFTVDDGNLPEFQLRCDDILSDVVFSPEIVFKALGKLKLSNTRSPDDFPAILLKLARDSLCYPLSMLFTHSFYSGCLPAIWLTADVCPIFKKGVSCNPGNYRPISLTCILCKVMETIIKDSMLSFLLKHKLISKAQHGFLSRLSTITQLLECSKFCVDFLDRLPTVPVDVLYVDFAKAFDSVSVRKLVHKLKGYGFSGQLLAWLTAFLSNRTQRVKVGSVFSSFINVTSGVPQGSVLGPLLFLLFINDLPDCILSSMIRLFADDVKLLSEISFGLTGPTCSLLLDCDILCSWSDQWQLQIAAHKCATLHLGHNNPNLIYKLHGQDVAASDSVKDLGVIFSSSFASTEHCKSIARKGFQRVNLIFRCFLSKDINCLLRAYITYVRPILEYASVVWSPYFVKDILLIERVQRRYTKRLLFYTSLKEPERSNMSYENRLAYFELQSLQTRRLIADVVFCHKIVHNLVDVNFDDFFIRDHNVSLRRKHSLQLYTVFCRKNVKKYFFSTRVVPYWNELPSTVVSCQSPKLFRKLISKIYN